MRSLWIGSEKKENRAGRKVAGVMCDKSVRKYQRNGAEFLRWKNCEEWVKGRSHRRQGTKC